MNIPRYWTRADGETTQPDGSSIKLTAWGWSATDAADARRNAEDRLSRMLARVESGGALPHKYAYGVRALREEVVEELSRSEGPAAIVTRNSYGSLVINAPDVMFVDVDTVEPSIEGFLGGLFGKKAKGNEDTFKTLGIKLSTVTSSAFRVYATAGGFRLMATERTFSPGSSEAEQIMEAVGADPAYVQLCRAQKSFRARLNPKPWRTGLGNPPNQFPREPREQATFDAWLAKYTLKSSDKAVCRYLGNAGGDRVAPSIAPVLKYHDERTRADVVRELQLA
jgi:hypothetical protein